MATTELDDDAKRATRAEFAEAVNMTAGQLRTWLDSDESRSVGDSGGSGKESTGHEMGRHIAELRGNKVADPRRQRLRADAQGRRLRAPAPGTVPGGRRHRHALALLTDELGPRPAEMTLAVGGRTGGVGRAP